MLTTTELVTQIETMLDRAKRAAANARIDLRMQAADASAERLVQTLHGLMAAEGQMWVLEAALALAKDGARDTLRAMGRTITASRLAGATDAEGATRRGRRQAATEILGLLGLPD